MAGFPKLEFPLFRKRGDKNVEDPTGRVFERPRYIEDYSVKKGRITEDVQLTAKIQLYKNTKVTKSHRVKYNEKTYVIAKYRQVRFTHGGVSHIEIEI